MVDKETITYTLSEIKKRKGTPYHMANEILADELYPYIKNEFPDVYFVKYGVTQWFAVSERAKKKLKKQLEERIEEHKKSLIELQNAIEQLSSR